MYLQWKDDYLIGHDCIDKQHKDLFSLANKIFDCDSFESMIPCFMALFEYTNYHFKEEEAVMLNFNYPEYEAHRVMHQDMVEALSRLSDTMAEGTLDTAKIHRFMANWVLVHICTEDKKLFDFVKG